MGAKLIYNLKSRNKNKNLRSAEGIEKNELYQNEYCVLKIVKDLRHILQNRLLKDGIILLFLVLYLK